jgi:outer membrane usher protein
MRACSRRSGLLVQTGILRSSFDSRFAALRLDTTLAYSDRDTLTSYRAGDAISGGLAWTRPIRIGGLQAQRNFGLRPDLVTLPLPSASGSAAVPSTVDVLVNNVRTASQEVESGPYRITNIPAVAGAGTARVVLRDASGRETVTDLPFYVSSKLLAQGLYDFSVEAGMPRLSYATAADTYATQFVASASGRFGVLDWLTLEGHAEAGAGLWNAGAGAAMRTGSFGVLAGALSASRFAGASGLQGYLAYEFGILGLGVQVSSQRTFRAYDDLASATARLQAGIPADTQSVLAGLSFSNPSLPFGAAQATPLWLAARPAKALDRISIALPLPFDLSTISASFIHLNDASGRVSNILSASWSRSFAYNVTAFATAFKDISDTRNCGIMVGLSIPLGDAAMASAGVSRDGNGTRPTFDAAKPLAPQPGSFGWRVHDGEGALPDRSGSIAYRSDFARMEVGARQNGRGASATAEVEGAVVTMGNGLLFANRIDDAFAVVDAGAPGVEVFHENRSMGFTDASGRLLIPSLRSYQRNKITIDARNLPVDADIHTTEEVVAPAERAGVRVNFGVRTNVGSAILALITPDGQPVPTGAQGQIEGAEAFVVGYDGRAFVKGLAPRNSVSVALAGRECRATFDYSARPSEQVVIPVVCR